MHTFALRPAVPGDLPAITALLLAENLPTVAIADNIAAFTVAERDTIIGVIGLHQAGSAALLRSLAVAPAFRKAGVAASLVDRTIAQARAAGADTLYLLTETAAAYFTRRGFVPVPRAAVPAALLTDSGLGDACPCCPCMRLDL